MPMTWPITIEYGLALPSVAGNSTVLTYLHSNATGERFTRGGLTAIDGAISRCARSPSLTSAPTSADVRLICSRKSQVVRLCTNSPLSSALVCECLRPALENITNGGRLETALKKLYGARFTTPVRLIVDIHPIGRGTTRVVSGSFFNGYSLARGSKYMVVTPGIWLRP